MINQSNKIRNQQEINDLDRIDFEIIAILANNARLSNKQLAARVGLAQSTCLQRVRRLIKEGVLCGFHAKVDLKALGFGLQAMISIQLRWHSRRSYITLRDYLMSLPEVVTLYDMTGKNDVLVHVIAWDSKHLRDLVVERLLTRKEVGHLETNVLFECVQRSATSLVSLSSETLSTDE